jgi:hypothetical protein
MFKVKSITFSPSSTSSFHRIGPSILWAIQSSRITKNLRMFFRCLFMWYEFINYLSIQWYLKNRNQFFICQSSFYWLIECICSQKFSILINQTIEALVNWIKIISYQSKCWPIVELKCWVYRWQRNAFTGKLINFFLTYLRIL